MVQSRFLNKDKLSNCRPAVCQCQCCLTIDELGSQKCAAKMEEIEKSLNC